MVCNLKLNSLIALAKKEKDIFAKMPRDKSCFIFVEELNCKPHVFEKVFPFRVVK